MHATIQKILLPQLIILITLITSPHTATAIDQKAWQLSCKKQKACKIYGYIVSDKKVIVSSISLMHLKVKGQKKRKLVGIVMLPLGLHIPSGVRLSFDNKVKVKANLVECKLKGCRALFTAEKIIIEQMKKGKTVHITIVDSKTRKGLKLQYGLKGFSKIYKEFLAKT